MMLCLLWNICLTVEVPMVGTEGYCSVLDYCHETMYPATHCHAKTWPSVSGSSFCFQTPLWLYQLRFYLSDIRELRVRAHFQMLFLSFLKDYASWAIRCVSRSMALSVELCFASSRHSVVMLNHWPAQWSSSTWLHRNDSPRTCSHIMCTPPERWPDGCEEFVRLSGTTCTFLWGCTLKCTVHLHVRISLWNINIKFMSQNDSDIIQQQKPNFCIVYSKRGS